MIRFILNEKEIVTEHSPGQVLLDLVRYDQHLTGTKIGCREGDCGACTILVGELKDDRVIYQSMTSCLMPIANAAGKHIVTIEGLNSSHADQLNPVQQAMAEEGATQCGFCTPGFVVSFAGYCLSSNQPSEQNAIASINGNICRCTGYKSIERAAATITALLKTKKADQDTIRFAIEQKLVPDYFNTIKDRLISIQNQAGSQNNSINKDARILAGGTDLYVQHHEGFGNESLQFLFNDPSLKDIRQEGDRCYMGGSATVTALRDSPIFQKAFKNIDQITKLVSSTPIRNMATVAGNIINASPIGDLTIFLLALDAQVVFKGVNGSRTVPLRKLYLGYKKLDRQPGELVEHIYFNLPAKNTLFNFEKVSKRMHLDIASVNSAIQLSVDGDIITGAGISAGGVGPIPMFLNKTSSFLVGKKITTALVFECIKTLQTEISPISDARGSAEYKTLLLGQLIKSHFITLFPDLEMVKLLKA